MAAAELASKGHQVAIFEQFSRPGFPNHCSGLISEEGFRKLGFSLPSNLIENRVACARIFAPNGKFLSIRRKTKEMLVVDRAGLDVLLAEKATSQGATINYSHTVTSLLFNKKRIIGCSGKTRNDQWHAFAPITICAEGVKARILKKHGYPTTNYKWNLPAVQYELENVEIDRDTVDLYHGLQWAPGFFAWTIPTREGCVRVGLAALRGQRLSSRQLLDKILTKHLIASNLLKGYRIVSIRGGIVPAAGPLSQTVFDGLIVTGDAAGQAKPTTGGGVNIGGHCARIAGTVASDALEKDRFDKTVLKKYENLWRRLYHRELLLMSIFRRSIGRMPNKRLNEGIIALKRVGFESVLNELRDIDLHARELSSKLFRPILLRQMISGLPFAIAGLCSTFFDN